MDYKNRVKNENTRMQKISSMIAIIFPRSFENINNIPVHLVKDKGSSQEDAHYYSHHKCGIKSIHTDTNSNLCRKLNGIQSDKI